MTAVVFEFSKFAAKTPAEKRESDDASAVALGQVIIFTGVRQERLVTDESDAPAPSRRKTKA